MIHSFSDYSNGRLLLYYNAKISIIIKNNNKIQQNTTKKQNKSIFSPIHQKVYLIRKKSFFFSFHKFLEPLEIRVFIAFGPFIRLLTAYNSDHFSHSNWRCILRSVFFAIGTISLIFLVPIWLTSDIWELSYNEADLKAFVLGLLVFLTLLQWEMTSIAFMLKTRIVIEVGRAKNVDQKK